jgi:predicted  nucleic acid-binding Zn-ribbon protein
MATEMTIQNSKTVIAEDFINKVSDEYGITKDIDNYTFSATAGNKYVFEITTDSTYKDFQGVVQYNSIDSILTLNNQVLSKQDGVTVDTSTQGKTIITMVAQQSGTFSLNLSGFAGYSTSEFAGMQRVDTPYTLTAQDFGSVDKYSNIESLAYDIALSLNDSNKLYGQIADASIYSALDDIDWYKFTADSTKDYSVTVKNSSGESKKILISAGDRDIHFGKDSLTQTQKYYTPTKDGETTFNVTGTVGDYTVEIEEIVVDQHGGTNDTATDLTALVAGVDETPTATDGNILNWTDDDVFKVSATNGKYYQVTIRSEDLDSWRGNNDFDVSLDGQSISTATVLWQTYKTLKTIYDDKVVVDFVATEDKDYFIKIDSMFANGDYTIEVQEKEDDFAWDFTNYATLQDVPTLQLGVTTDANVLDVTDYAVANGFYDPDDGYKYKLTSYIDMDTQHSTKTVTGNDIDLFKISVESGKTYHFQATAQNGFSPMFNIITADGSRVESNISGNWTPIELSDGWTTDYIYVATETSSEYYLEVIGQGAVGDYTIKYEEFVASDDSIGGDDFASAQILDMSNDKVSVSSKVDTSKDNDIFKFLATADTRYEIKQEDIGYSGTNGPFGHAEVFLVENGNESFIYSDYDMFDKFKSFYGSSTVNYNLEKMVSFLSIFNVADLKTYVDNSNSGDLNGVITYEDYIAYGNEYVKTMQTKVYDTYDNNFVTLNVQSTYETFQNFLDNYNSKLISILNADSSIDKSANDSSIKDSVITLLEGGMGIDSSSRISYTALSDGYIYVRPDDATKPYTYTINIQKKGGDYIGNSIEKAVLYDQADKSNGELKSYSELGNNAEADGVLQGTLEKIGDKDFYKLELEANKTYEITSNKWYTELKFYDANGERIVQDSFWQSEGDGTLKDVYIGITGTQKTFAVETSGVYYIDVEADDSWENWTGDYQLTLKEVTKDDDFGSSIKSAGDFNQYKQVLTADGDEYTALKGNIDYTRDADWIKLDTVVGQDYKITLDSATMDKLNLKIMNANGQEVFLKSSYVYNNADSDLDSQGSIMIDWDSQKDAALTLSSTGTTYYAQVQSFRETGEYELTFNEDNSSDDYGSSFLTMGDFKYINATDGDATDNTISAKLDKLGDVDWFSYDFKKGGVYEIILDSATVSGNNLKALIGDLSRNKTKDATTSSTTDKHFVFTSQYDGFGIIEIKDTYNVGSYSITVNELASDEFDGDRANSKSVELLDDILSVDDSLLNSKDNDIKKIELQKGVSYLLELSASDSTNSDSLGQMRINLMDADTDSIEENIVREWNSDIKERMLFTPTESGTYYIDIKSISKGIGEYNLKVTKTDLQNDIASTVDGASDFVTLDSDNDGVITSKIDTVFDTDFIKISVSAAKQYIISIDSADTDSADIFILDSNGDLTKENQIWDGDSHNISNSDKTIIFNPTADGEYYIVAKDSKVTDYDISVQEFTDTNDIVDDSSTSATTSVGNTLTSMIDKTDDKDWIKISLTQGNVYKFDVSKTADAQTLSSSFAINGLYDANTNFISGTSSTNGEVYYKASSSADYFIEVASTKDSLGVYDLNVSSFVGTDNQGDDTSTSETTTVGGNYSSNIDYFYDRDWIKVSLQQDKTYSFSVDGKSLNDVVLGGIYDSSGDIIADTFNDNFTNFTLDAKTLYTATQSGDYFIEVYGKDDQTGSYSVSVEQTDSLNNLADESSASNDANNTTSSAITDNKLKKYIYGEINYDGDSDYYEFNLEKGMTYSIDMLGLSTDSGTLNDTWIKSIRDSNGVEIANASNARGGDGNDSNLTFTASETGKYYIETSSQNGALGSFRLKVKETAGINSDVQAKDYSSGSHTIMIYLAGDNNLEKYMVDDLIEMQLGELPDDFNVTFLIDRAEGFYTGFGDWTDTRQGIVTFADETNWEEAQTEVLSAMESLGEQNTGDGQTLTNFMNWSAVNAQADNYSLIISNHGGGIPGTAWDEGNGNDNLKIEELTEAIKNSLIYKDTQSGQKALQMVGFDTCLQGIIDQQYALVDVTDTVVASEEVSWTFYWDHSKWFENITKTYDDNGGSITGAEMGLAFTSTLKGIDTKGKDITYSVVDTDSLSDVITAMNDLNTSLASITSEEQSLIKANAQQVVSFGNGSNIDIGAFANMIDSLDISADIDTKAQAVVSAVNTAVLSNITNMDGQGGDASGISMYFNGGYETDAYMDNFELAGLMNMSQFYDIV